MNTCRSRNVLLLTFFLTVHFLTAVVYSDETHAINLQNIDALKSSVDSLLRKYKIPGAGIALVSKDSILWSGGVGVADIKEQKPVTEKTHFRVGSVTKSFVAMGFLKLVQEGKIDLNTPVKEIAPEIEFENPYEKTDPVRIVHLLEHTAGFDDMHFKDLYNIHDDPEIPLKEALTISAKSLKVRWRPGTRMAYANPGYALAGYIMEKVTGERFEDYLKKVVLSPLGMEISSFRLTEQSKDLLASGYGDDGAEPVPYYSIYLRPAGSLNSSPQEMALFVQFLLNRGALADTSLIREDLINRMEKPISTLAAKAGLKTGYGLGNYSRFNQGFITHGHDGGIDGFISRYSYITDLGLGYVVLVNSTHSGEGYRAICDTVLHYLVAGEKPPQPAPGIQLLPEKLDNFTGYYEMRNPRNQLFAFLDLILSGTTISLENDTLRQGRFASDEKALLSVTPRSFRKKDEPEASMVFTTSDDGVQVLAGGWEYFESSAGWKPLVYRGLFFGAFAIMASALLYALVWIPLHIYKKVKNKENRSRYLRMRIVPLLAVLSLFAANVALTTQPLYEIGQQSFANMVFYIGTILFAVLSFLSLLFALRSFGKPVRKLARIYAVVLSLACSGMAVFLWFWNIIGLKFWEY